MKCIFNFSFDVFIDSQTILTPKAMFAFESKSYIICLTVLTALVIKPCEGCWCTKIGRQCGHELDSCKANIIYECDRVGAHPRQVQDCPHGCNLSIGRPMCWQKITTSLVVN